MNLFEHSGIDLDAVDDARPKNTNRFSVIQDALPRSVKAAIDLANETGRVDWSRIGDFKPNKGKLGSANVHDYFEAEQFQRERSWLDENLGKGRGDSSEVLSWHVRGLDLDRAREYVCLKDSGGKWEQRAIGKAPMAIESFIDRFSYTDREEAAIRRPFELALARLNAKAPVDLIAPAARGDIYLSTEPTGMGKSRAAAIAVARGAAEYARAALASGQPKPRPRTILIVAPTFALLENPKKDLEAVLAREEFDDIRHLISIDTLGGTARLLAEGKEAVPQDCPARDGFSRELKAYRDKAQDNALPSDPRTDESYIHAMTAVRKGCHAKFTEAAGSPCHGCRLMNPARVAYRHEADERPISIAFLTYSKLMNGLKLMSLRKGKATSVTLLPNSNESGRSLPPATIIMEEAVEGYGIIWNSLRKDLTGLDVVELANTIADRSGVLREVSQIAKRLVRAGGSGEQFPGLEDIVETVDRALSDFRKEAAELYVLLDDGTKFHPYAHGAPSAVRFVPSEDENLVSRFSQIMEVSFSFLSHTWTEKGNVTYVARRQEDEGRDTIFIELGTDQANGHKVEDLVSNLIRKVIKSFVYAHDQIRNKIRKVYSERPDLEMSMLDAFEGLMNRFFMVNVPSGTKLIRDAFDTMAMALRSTKGPLIGKNKDGDNDYMDMPEHLRMRGYHVTELQYEQSDHTYKVVQEIANGSPEGVVMNLASSGSDVLLVSATVDYPNPIETFSMPFLSAHGFAPIRPEESVQADQASAVERKYAGRKPLKCEIVDDLFEAGALIRRPPLTGPNMKDFYERCVIGNPRFQSYKEKDGSLRERNHLSAVLGLINSINSGPCRPRYVVVLTNSKNEAGDALALIKEYERFCEDNNINGHAFDVTLESSKAIDPTAQDYARFRKKQGEFVKSLLDPEGCTPRSLIVIAARQSLGVGANMQIEIDLADVCLGEGGTLPRNLHAYLGNDGRMRAFKGTNKVQIDISDMVICLRRTNIVSNTNDIQVLLTAVAENLVPLIHARGHLKGGGMEILPVFKAYGIEQACQAMSAIQYIGRLDRTLNAPTGQRIWMHSALANAIGTTPDARREDRTLIPQTPSFRSVVDFIRRKGEERYQSTKLNDASEKLTSLAHIVMGQHGLPPLEALELWEALRDLSRRHSLTNRTFFEGTLARKIDALCKAVSDFAAGMGLPMLSSVKELYMKVERQCGSMPTDPKWHVFRPNAAIHGFTPQDHSEARYVNFRAVIGVADEDEFVSRTAPEVPEAWWGFTRGVADWIGPEATILGDQTAPVFVMRPSIYHELVLPARDEARTAHLLRAINGLSILKMPDEIVEKVGDHLVACPEPRFLIDNKSHSIMKSFMGLDAESDQERIEIARRKLSLAREHYRSIGKPEEAPQAFVYLFRRPVTKADRNLMFATQKHNKAAFRVVPEGQFDWCAPSNVPEGTRADVWFVSMPPEWDVSPLRELVVGMRTMFKKAGVSENE